MYKFSKKIAYSIEAVLLIANRGTSNPSQSKELSEALGVPPRYLEQVLQQLVRNHVLNGVRGPKGGYILDRNANEITLKEIADVVRSLEPTTCTEGNPRETVAGGVIAPVLDEMAQRVDQTLTSLRISDLMAQSSSTRPVLQVATA